MVSWCLCPVSTVITQEIQFWKVSGAFSHFQNYDISHVDKHPNICVKVSVFLFNGVLHSTHFLIQFSCPFAHSYVLCPCLDFTVLCLNILHLYDLHIYIMFITCFCAKTSKEQYFISVYDPRIMNLQGSYSHKNTEKNHGIKKSHFPTPGKVIENKKNIRMFWKSHFWELHF